MFFKKKPKLTPEQQIRVEKLRRMTPAEYDAICKRCGVCCLHKISGFSGRTMYLKLCCEHLNPDTKTCDIYSQRLDKCNNCCKLTPDVVVEGELLPASCAYSEYVFGPAKHPAQVDFTTVQPIPDSVYLPASARQFVQLIIAESVLWNRYTK